MSELYNRIERLCAQNKVTITAMCRESGASRASLSDLKVGRKQSLSADTLDKIANYFSTTVDYLLGRTDDPENSDRFGLEDPVSHFYDDYEDDEKAPTLTPKDERDIERRLSEVLEELERGQDGLMFSGETMDETTRELLAASLRNSMEIGKTLAKKKYTPKKYRKED